LARAIEAVRDTRNDPVPLHLRNAVTGLMRGMGYGKDYRYSHDYADEDRDRWTQRYLPDNLQDRRFYEPGGQGFEGSDIGPRIARIRALADDPSQPLNAGDTSLPSDNSTAPNG
jgi:putative ATPase